MDISRFLSIGRLGLAALLVAGLAGCGGGDDGVAVVVPPVVPPAAAVGAAITTAAALPASDTAVTPTAAFSVLQDAGLPIATTASPMKINFTVFSNGAVKTGLTLANFSVAIAKLVPGTNGAPDQWVNYIYRTESTATAPNNVGSGAGGTAALASALQATTDPKPATMVDQLVYNSDGYYTYTFSTDVRDPAFNANGVKTNGVVFEPTRTHRVALQLSYVDAAGKTVLVNPYYDFKFVADGAGYKAVALTNPATETRIMADINTCNTCHKQLQLHGGGRVDVQYCVMCHNAGTVDANSGNNLDLRSMVHKIHAGHLTKNGLSIWGYGSTKHDYADVAFPQDIRNCSKCHSDTAGAGTPNLTAQGDNWKSVPSRAACGSCHDGIDFATGGGTTINPGKLWASVGHVGGAQADDSKCAICHNAGNIPGYHVAVAPPNPLNAYDTAVGGNNNTNAAWLASNDANLPAGAIKVSYDIKEVKVVSGNPVMVFRLLQNGARKDLNTSPAKTEIWDNFIGSPSAYFVFSVPQDGITAPADFNVSASGYIKKLWDGTATGTGAGTLSGPDADGYYTATLTGLTIPANATMLTGGLGFTYSLASTQPLTQTNVAGYPMRACTNPAYAASGNICGGLSVPARNVVKVATGHTPRRAIVDNANCNQCHEKLGLFTDANFHAGQRNDGTVCAFCHNPNRTSSGWSADSSSYIHAIHGASKRTVPFNWHATATASFADVRFPGGHDADSKLKRCETCHKPDTYDFKAPASLSAVSSRLFRTVATGNLTAGGISISPYVSTASYGSGFSYNVGTGVTTAAAGTTLVNSPIATACFSCHDGDLKNQPGTKVQDHIEQMGVGSIYKDRTTALAKSEQCLLCHGATSTIKPIKAAHGQ
jgi:OmcA/MtrC family decaheme c-type cytochrome